MKKNVLIISGTRAEFGLLQTTIVALKISNKIAPLLLITGMHTLKRFGYTLEEIKSGGYKIDRVVEISQDGDMISWFVSETLGIGDYLRSNKVDCILLLGDRDEMLAGAIVGTHLGIPIGHIHGGDMSGEAVVDSKNRNAITQFATFHFAATEKSAARISKMRQSDENVFVVGAPGIDLLLKIPEMKRETIAKKFALNLNKKWLLVVDHPAPLAKLSPGGQIGPLIDALLEIDAEIIWIYPNSDTGSDIFIKEIEGFAKRKAIKLFKNLPREDFVGFLSVVDALVGNSSLGIIESTYFHLPVINIGDRQKGRERSTNIIDCGYNKGEIIEAIKRATSEGFKKVCKDAKQIYGDGNSGAKIVRILEEKL